MNIVGAQLLSLSCLFLSMLGAFLLPYWYVGNNVAFFSSPRYLLHFSYANCFSGGVFLGTFFIGLVPEVRDTFDNVFQSYGFKTEYPVSECVVILGFMLSFWIEQCVLSKREQSDSQYTSIPNGADEGSKIDLISNSSSSKDEKTTETVTGEYESDSNTRTLALVVNETSPELANGVHTTIDHHSHSGHSHADFSQYLNGNSGFRRGMLIISLGIHSLFEGLAVGLQTSVPVLVNLVIGVAIHEVLVAFAMGVNISRLQLQKSTVYKFAVVFSSFIPVGQVIGLTIGYYNSKPAINAISAILQGLAAGTFIHITFMEVIPAEFQESGHRILKVIFLTLGATLIAINTAITEVVLK